MTRTIVALTFACGVSACASAPPAPPPLPPGPSAEEKFSWMLRLEDQRVLRDPVPAVSSPPPTIVPVPRGQTAPIVALPPAPPDLLKLLTDGEARVRRRAALAVGRVGLGEGVQPLVALLGDPDPEVKQIAAFALGLIGDKSARDPLVAALGDSSPIVKGSAAEALGLIGDPSAAIPIGQMAAAIAESGVLEPAPGNDEDDMRRDTPAAAFRLAIYALVRLKAYAPLASAVLDANGQPRLRWWPVAYGLQQIDDDRALPALMTLVKETHPYVRAFAVKGLGRPNNHAAVPVLLPFAAGSDRVLAIEAIRSLGRTGDPAASPALLKLIQTPKADPDLRVEALSAIGNLGGDGIVDSLLDVLGDPNPLVRAAALRSLAQLDREGFMLTLSGMDPDPHWSVRSALASVLATLPSETALPRLRAMLGDTDQRVIPAVLNSLAKLRAPDAASVILDRLKADDPAVRAAAAAAVGELKPANGPAALAEAYRAGQRDAEYAARATALRALAQYGATVTPVMAVLNDALTDKDWAVRVRAASLLKQLDPTSEVEARIRPAPPNAITSDLSQVLRLANPPVSTEVYIDTDRGTIQLELAVLDAPIAVENFVVLARKGFFNGLTFHRVVPDFVIQGGDPRGDGEGGPGYTIRDELNERPFLRGTVGMALDWNDTAGSQFFITHSPQPQLDGKYTVFGRVIAGIEVVDQIRQGDVIRRVRVWDGAEAK